MAETRPTTCTLASMVKVKIAPKSYDEVISAEMPDPNINKELYDTVIPWSLWSAEPYDPMHEEQKVC